MSQDAIKAVRERFADAVVAENEFRGEWTFNVKAESVRDIAIFLKNEQGFDYLIDVSSLDHFGDSPRFEMVYELYSMSAGLHLRLRSTVPDDDTPTFATVSDIWPTADWHEREVFDMMGIRFDGHKDLRRILMWDGYPYFPLRKDFPLQGKVSDIEEVAFTEVAPLAGGPFVTVPTEGTTQVREPRARRAGDEPDHDQFIAEP